MPAGRAPSKGGESVRCSLGLEAEHGLHVASHTDVLTRVHTMMKHAVAIRT